jgi:DNA (cytosine-5)-methyltransferase 1
MKYNYHREIEILEQFYQEAIELIKNQALSEIEEEIKVSLYIFIHKIETDKSLIQVIITTHIPHPQLSHPKETDVVST